MEYPVVYFGPKSEVQIYAAAPGGGLDVVTVKIPSQQLSAETLWQRLQSVSQDGRPAPASDTSLLEARQEGTLYSA